MTARRIAASAAIFTMLGSSLAPSVPVMASQEVRGQQGYCRQPARLPQLSPEVDPRRNEQIDRRVRRGARDTAGVYATPPPVSAAPAGEEEITVTGTRVRAPARVAESAPSADAASSATPERAGDARVMGGVMMPPRPPRPQPTPQSGLLTAGEHDDLLNPELFSRYLQRYGNSQQIAVVPSIAASNLLTVVVRDGAGRPVPFADVVLTCSDGNSITLASQGDGRVVFFPVIDHISPSATIRIRQDGRWLSSPQQVVINHQSGRQLLTMNVSAAARAPTKLDLMLVVDTTGSMGDEIRYLQSELRAIIADISRQHSQLDIRIGFVFYRDEGDDYVTRTYGFDRNMAGVDAVLAQQYAAGGGDYPEAMDQALIRAVGQDWRPDAIKSLLLVADAPPHDRNIARTWTAAEAARASRIHITPVAASGVADTAEYVMRAMAALTQSRYLFLTDDSGIGNPHAPPAVDCYLVTRLDAQIRRVIDSQISGRRIEPRDGEIIRTVGQYDAGRCVLPPDFTAQ